MSYVETFIFEDGATYAYNSDMSDFEDREDFTLGHWMADFDREEDSFALAMVEAFVQSDVGSVLREEHGDVIVYALTRTS